MGGVDGLRAVPRFRAATKHGPPLLSAAALDLSILENCEDRITGFTGTWGGTASVPSHEQGRDEARPSPVVRSGPGPFNPVHLVHPVKNLRRIVLCGSSQGRMKSEPDTLRLEPNRTRCRRK